MANPMQRRAKNSFLLGFLLALIIMALVVALLIFKMNKLNEEKKAIESKQKTVSVAATDLESGEELTINSLVNSQVQTTVNQTEIVSNTLLNIIDEETGETVKYKMKVAVPAGTIITKDMITEDKEGVSNDERIQEYNSIRLPSQLKNGDYIDIRFCLPTGEDYIVLSKKKVEGTNQDTVWIKVSEEEILTLNNAIVETWTITGAKIYAITYSDPGIQEKAKQTYPVSAEIYKQIANNPNIVDEAKKALNVQYNDGQIEQRNNRINSTLQQYIEDRDTLVEAGVSEENKLITELRKEYVTSLEGTDSIGYIKE